MSGNDKGRRQPRFAGELYATRAEVFRMLPDVRRNLAISAFESTIEEVRRGEYVGPLELSQDDVEDGHSHSAETWAREAAGRRAAALGASIERLQRLSAS